MMIKKKKKIINMKYLLFHDEPQWIILKLTINIHHFSSMRNLALLSQLQ